MQGLYQAYTADRGPDGQDWMIKAFFPMPILTSIKIWKAPVKTNYIFQRKTLKLICYKSLIISFCSIHLNKYAINH